MIRVGFILLTHSHPKQILELATALNALYDTPPIVCHHDFSQTPLEKGLFSNNVRFVEPHLRTSWGCFAIVPAALKALRILMSSRDVPDWFYLLSGSDYPALSPDQVLATLSATPYDAFIDHREITYSSRGHNGTGDISGGFARDSYVALAYRRYCAVAVPRPSRAKPCALPPEGRIFLRHPLWRFVVPGPFSQDFRCFAGEHWFSANSKAAELLLSQTAHSQRLLSHLARRESPEECFYHSVLANSSLKLSGDHLRYIVWPSPGAWHPKTLGLTDLHAILNSGAHFARKVPPASPLIKQLNHYLGVSKAAMSIGG